MGEVIQRKDIHHDSIFDRPQRDRIHKVLPLHANLHLVVRVVVVFVPWLGGKKVVHGWAGLVFVVAVLPISPSSSSCAPPLYVEVTVTAGILDQVSPDRMRSLKCKAVEWIDNVPILLGGKTCSLHYL